ncbi:electron transfer flavoprotein subunit alpha/FixB family protein [Salinicola rhizosphaerae]|uniref:Electron transfer flavoprotein subunit alpha n=1 Tax=Salinicola rhizosphaerae TaxID=1443141 RepID=A0ABQ3E3T5_9GAMM|nr:electron transfer flavoprotein subunit alpha/FixB family protein [Salinicola rhizosphaerae]GHB24014.1 electron transfer flavoprotein subunit alpha [Salinicola rhizosphaerae]
MSVRRIDPHAERIRRNRLHPRHREFARPAWRWTSAEGVTRINPHALGAIGPNGIKRLDRSGASVEASIAGGGQASTEPARRQITLEVPSGYIMVVPELAEGRLSDHDRDLLGLARQLAGDTDLAVTAVTFLSDVAGLEEAGADRRLDLANLVDAETYDPESRLAALVAAERELVPSHWIFADDFPGGGDLGRRLAARLTSDGVQEARPATRVWQVADGRSLSRAGDRQDIQRDVPKILIALAECADPVSETRHEARPMTLEADNAAIEITAGIVDRGRVAVDPQQIPLAQAPFILSAGRGVADWAGFHHAADVLGASEGASRVAVDDGNMPRARQVGATGTFVAASCYIAVGISGAVQHLQGITRCQRVIAINRDPTCDMVKRADLAIIADGDAVLAAVCQQLGRPTPVPAATEERCHDAA